MELLKTQTLRGPNYWSIRYGKLIVARIDLEDLAERPSNKIPGLYDGLIKTLPSLIEHFCSPGTRGGFLRRLQEGTLMGHVIEHVALELQVLAGMEVGFGRTRETSTPGIYQVVFEYVHEAAGRYAARAALRLCESIIQTGEYPQSELQKDLEDLQELATEAALGPSTEALVREAEARGIPWLEVGVRGLLQLGYGVHQKRIQASLTSHSDILSVELACDKESTKQLLGNSGVPVPKGTVVYSLREFEDALDWLGGFPVVVKPLNGNHGRGITLDIRSWEQAEKAYDKAREVSSGVIVEHHYQGRDHRVLVVNHKVVAVAERVPAHVVGNGKSTIAELVENVNNQPERGQGHDKALTEIVLDCATNDLLEAQSCSLDTVLKEGEICYLRATANLSTGGIAIDRTNEIHPETVWVAERASRLVGLDIAGIDIVTPDISEPLSAVDGVIVEVNAAPGLRMHVSPSVGVARNVAAPILDMLLPPEAPARIPIVAITGTNGKTTTTRLTAHIFRQVYGTVGYTTTDGIYIGNHLVEKGDTTGPQSAQVILQDPTVEMAVLETARGGLLRSGLAFEHCDVGIVLNVAADHLGIGDIDTLDQLARLKAVVAEAAEPDRGYAILNADDERVAAMARHVRAKIAYFSMNPQNELVRSHVEKGGVAAIYENGYISILQKDWTHPIVKAEQVPLTMGGKAPFMIANALAASLAGFVQGVKIDQLGEALRTFEASATQIPGRMNLFNLGSYHVLIDYAHNPAGYAAVGSFVKNWSGPTLGVVGAPGDRRDEDFVALGELAADIFDQIVIKEDDDRRGRDHGEVAELIELGILQTAESSGLEVPYKTELNEVNAVEWALDHAPEGGLVVILPESVRRAISLISARGPISEGFAAPSEEPLIFETVQTLNERQVKELEAAKKVVSLNGAGSQPSTSHPS